MLQSTEMGSMQDTILDGIALWSVWQPDRRMFFNSFFVQQSQGNVVVDPLVLDDNQLQCIQQRGGIAWIIITNRDHERRARDLATQFGAKIAAGVQEAALLSGPVDRTLHEGEEAFAGARVIELPHGKTPGEIALHLEGRKAAIVGDALWGDPAGKVRLPPHEKLADPVKAVLALRKIWALRLDTLLVGDGACIWAGADKIIGDCLQSRRDVYVNRINLEELTPEPFSEIDGKYEATDYEIGFLIGARKLGYRVTVVPPGKVFCPLHSHALEEEMFLILEGEPTIRTTRGEVQCRAGDVFAFPTGDEGTHHLINKSDKPCRVFMLGNTDPNEVCYYPDSDKVMVDSRNVILRATPSLDYFDGE